MNIDDINFDDWDWVDEPELRTKRVRFVKILKVGDSVILNGAQGIVEKMDRDRGGDTIAYINIDGMLVECIGYRVYINEKIILEKII